MSIKGRIRALQAVIALTVAAMAALVFFGLSASSHYLERAQWAREQLAAISQLAIDANRYSEQIAELMLVGEPERPDFDSARVEVSRTLARLRETTRREADLVRGSVAGEGDEERVEMERLDRMRVLFREIDRAVERLLVLDQLGRRADSIALFRSDIENRLDAEFARLIGEALEDERAEVDEIEAGLARLTRFLRITILSSAALVMAIAVVAGQLFARSIERPIKALTDGALAIERGRLDHRIAYRGNDEHAVLSERFNAMAEQLGRQRAMILAAQEDLERQVVERTEELADANRRLLATDRERVALLTDVSHELRTPLTALRGEAEIALRGASKPEAEYRGALSKVVARAQDLARLVEDLLFLARTEAGEIRPQLQPVNLNALVGEAVEQASILGRERGIGIEFSAPPTSAIVGADPRRLRQVILILLDNALQYADKGTSVAVDLRSEAEAVEVSIRDRGKGIAAEDLPHVFERFYRGADARDRWHGGAGLGLPIARRIVEQHGGSIELSSTAGEGSEAVLRFPLAGAK